MNFKESQVKKKQQLVKKFLGWEQSKKDEMQMLRRKEFQKEGVVHSV